MSTNVIYLKSDDRMALPTFNHLRPAENENLNFSPTIHVNPLRTTNRILVNKEKLNKGIRSMEAQQTNPTAERIYYNPKFLTKHVQNASKNYITPNTQHQTSRSEIVKTFDSNIHINRNYLVALNDARTVKSLSYSCDETRLNSNKQNLGGIHINPKFIKKQKPVENVEVDKVPNRSLSSSHSAGTISVKNISPLKEKNYLKNTAVNSVKSTIKLTVQPKSKYKFVKNMNSPPKIQNPEKNQIVLKPLCFKTKYSLKRFAVGKENNKTNCRNSEVPKLKLQINPKIKLVKPSSEFKKLSRTKLVRKSVLQSMILARRSSRNNLFRKLLTDRTFYRRIPLKEKTTNITYFPKRNEQISKNKIASIGNSSFKRLSKMKIVRKSLLKAQIEARNQVRKQYLREHRILKSNKSYISKFKIRNNSIRRKFVNKQRSLLRWRKKKQGSDTSRIKCKKTNSNPPSSKSLRKNNQPCPFYNRFGRCKGRDRGTCPKLHDPKYISICRKLLQGECNAKDCLLSHDIRPGKMPTCHHYLAGLCTRPNCPFLHIKVNPKAPICAAFLQGFCPDIFNCLKRHEFICPIYAEKGTCPRGKSCTYPHRSQIVHSKLLKDDQKPLLIHRTDSSVSTNSIESKTKPEVSESTETSLDCDSRKKRKRNLENNKNIKRSKKEYVREAFKRYFVVAKSDESSDDEKKLKESIVDVSVNEFR